MVKFTKFSNVGGMLVYSKTGKLAPDKYTVKGSTVYGADGRKIGSVGIKNIKAPQIATAKKTIAQIPKRVRAGKATLPKGLNEKSQSNINFEGAVRSAVQDGLISGAEGQGMIAEYIIAAQSGDKEKQSELWNRIHMMYNEVYGFRYEAEKDEPREPNVG